MRSPGYERIYRECVQTNLELFQSFLNQRHSLLVRLGGRRLFVCVLKLLVQRQRSETGYVQIVVLLQDQLDVFDFDIFRPSVLSHQTGVGSWEREKKGRSSLATKKAKWRAKI